MDDTIREGDLFNAKFDDGTEYFNRVCKKNERWNDFINCKSRTKVYTKVKKNK